MNRNFNAINLLLQKKGVLSAALLRLTLTPYGIASHIMGVTSIRTVDYFVGTCAYGMVLIMQVFLGCSIYSVGTTNFKEGMSKQSTAKSVIFLIEVALTVVITIGMAYYAKNMIQGHLSEYRAQNESQSSERSIRSSPPSNDSEETIDDLPSYAINGPR